MEKNTHFSCGKCKEGNEIQGRNYNLVGMSFCSACRCSRFYSDLSEEEIKSLRDRECCGNKSDIKHTYFCKACYEKISNNPPKEDCVEPFQICRIKNPLPCRKQWVFIKCNKCYSSGLTRNCVFCFFKDPEGLGFDACMECSSGEIIFDSYAKYDAKSDRFVRDENKVKENEDAQS